MPKKSSKTKRRYHRDRSVPIISSVPIRISSPEGPEERFASTFQPVDIAPALQPGAILEHVKSGNQMSNSVPVDSSEVYDEVTSTTVSYEEEKKEKKRLRRSLSPGTPRKDEEKLRRKLIEKMRQKEQQEEEEDNDSCPSPTDIAPADPLQHHSTIAISPDPETPTPSSSTNVNPVTEEKDEEMELNALPSQSDSSIPSVLPVENEDSVKGNVMETSSNSSTPTMVKGSSSAGSSTLGITKIRVMNLIFPSALNDELLRGLMTTSQSFHAWFESTGPDKKGGISFTFESETEAMENYEQVKNHTINGEKVKVQAPKHFSNSAEKEKLSNGVSSGKKIVFSISDNNNSEQESHVESVVQELLIKDPSHEKKLFISQLLPSTQEELILAIFDKESLENVELNIDERKTDGSKVAILTFQTEELAKEGKREFNGFALDDGEMTRQIKILSYADYLRDQQWRNLYGIPRPQKKVAPSSSNQQLTNKDTENKKNDDFTGVSHKAGSQWSEQIQTAGGIKKRPSNEDGDQEESEGGGWKLGERKDLQTATAGGEKEEGGWSVGQRKGWKMGQKMKIDIDIPQNPEIKLRNVQREKPEDMSVGQIKGWIESVIAEERINWGEMSTVQDLWGICDKVQEQAGWIPDIKLKAGMLKALEGDLGTSQQGWIHKHLEQLIRTWKKETRKEGRSDAGEKRTFTLKAPTYEPPPPQPERKFRSAEHRKQVVALMGVGAMLAAAKEKHLGEDGEVRDNDEDSKEETKPEEQSSSVGVAVGAGVKKKKRKELRAEEKKKKKKKKKK